MTTDELKKKSKEEVLNFIRERLRFEDKVISSLRRIDYDKLENQHKRFDMSDCTTWNLSLLNEFADLGIYEYTSYLFLNFYKGTPTIYLKYFYENENIEIDDLSGLGTTEIIYRVFELTIFSNKRNRNKTYAKR